MPDAPADPADQPDARTDPPDGSFPHGFDTPPEGPATLPQAQRPRLAAVAVRVGGYELLGELGRGGMGVVYKARQVGLNRAVALKMILSGAHAAHSEVARFLAEAEVVARLQHPNIVQIYEAGEHGGRPFLSLELVPGTNLHARLAGTPQSPGPAGQLVEILARAVHFAHQRGIVHRDLKPGNVLLAPHAPGTPTDPGTAQAVALYGVPKITDFGLAKRTDQDHQQTRSGDLLGTPSYMAPEQAAGRACGAGPEADVYSLGAVLYECLTGRPPFRGATPVETLNLVLTEEPVAPSQLVPRVPRDLERICLKCLEKDPRKRYATAEELADDLKRWRSGETVHARPAPLHERVWRWSRRNPIPASLLVATTLGSAVGFWYLKNLSESLVRSAALQAAAQQAETMDELNKYYSRVSSHADPDKVKGGHAWKDSPGAVPAPATLTIELGQQITAASPTGMRVRLYSDYPFRYRTDGGPRDDFQRQALDELRADPSKPVTSFETLDGRHVLRYATARVMDASCVKCHNEHPGNSKHDWKPGDVRGVLEIVRPLDVDEARVSRGLRGTVASVAGVAAGLLGLSALALYRGNRSRRHRFHLPAPAADTTRVESAPVGPGAATVATLRPGTTPPGLLDWTPPRSPPTTAPPPRPPGGPPMPAPRDIHPSDATLPASTPRPVADPEETPRPADPGQLFTPSPESTLAGPPVPPGRYAAPDPGDDSPPEGTLVAPVPGRVGGSDGTPTTVHAPSHSQQPDADDAPAEGTLVAPAPIPTRNGRPASLLDIPPDAEATRVAPAAPGRDGGSFGTPTSLQPPPEADEPPTPEMTAVAPTPKEFRGPAADATRGPAGNVTITPEGTLAAPGRPDHLMNNPTVVITGPPGRGLAPQPGPGGIDRYVLRQLHAKGGLGEVYTAQDTELAREVALKRIKSRFADDGPSRRRFLSEARITARLDHPGVVPVFGLVADGNGRPCYAMRFIRGESFKDEIDRYHRKQRTEDRGQRTEKTEKTGTSADPQAAPQPAAEAERDQGDRRLAFRQLLARFVAVCQAIGYAHTRKVIHRDIKPANVMVGSFGETLVVDWGLAKVLDEKSNPDDDRPHPHPDRRPDPDATEQGDDVTAMGVAVGTPAYMPPEQAAGRHDIMGPAADIYSLGATLFYLLVGKAPFAGANVSETIEQVQKGDFNPPRAISPGVPRPLEAVCLRAMALKPEDRYATALDLAADVERWLSDEPVSCYRYTPWQRAARWARRNPARVAGVVSLLLTGMLAAALGFGLVSNEQRKTAAALRGEKEAKEKTAQALEAETKAKAETEAALGKEKVALAEETKAKAAAESAKKLAREQFDLARQILQTLVIDIQGQLADRAGTQDLRAAMLGKAQDGLRRLLKTVADNPGADERDADRLLFWAHAQMGDVYRSLGRTDDARGEYEAAVAVARRRVARDPADAEAKADLAEGLDKLADIKLQGGDSTGARDAGKESLDIREGLFKANPADRKARRDLAASRDRLAVVLLERGATEDAEKACDAALPARRDLYAEAAKDLDAARAAPRPHWLATGPLANRAFSLQDRTTALVDAARDLARSLERKAEILARRSRTDDARKAAEEALTYRQAVVAAWPDRTDARLGVASAHARVGDVAFDRGDMAAALAAFVAARDVLADALDHDPRSAGAKADLASVLARVAHVRLRTGQTEAALKDARDAVALAKELADLDRGSARARRELALCHERLGDTLLKAGRTADSLPEYARSLDLRRAAAADDPGSVRAKAELARGHEMLGLARLEADQLTAAVDSLVSALVIREEVAGLDPGSARSTRELAIALDRLCAAHLRAGNHVQARVAAYREHDLFAKLAADDPKSGQAKRDLAVAYGKWAEVALGQGGNAAALILLHKALDLHRELAELDPSNVQAREDEAEALERLSLAHRAVGNAVARLRAALDAVALREKLAAAHKDSPTARRDLVAALRLVADAHADRYDFRTARTWYGKARDAAKGFEQSPALAAELKTLDDRDALVAAVETGWGNPAALARGFPAEVRSKALRVIMYLRLDIGDPERAAQAADALAGPAATADDLFHAARGYAICSAKAGSPASKEAFAKMAADALRRAVAAGFRDSGALAEHWWNDLRERPDFRPTADELAQLPPLSPQPRGK